MVGQNCGHKEDLGLVMKQHSQLCYCALKEALIILIGVGSRYNYSLNNDSPCSYVSCYKEMQFYLWSINMSTVKHTGIWLWCTLFG